MPSNYVQRDGFDFALVRNVSVFSRLGEAGKAQKSVAVRSSSPVSGMVTAVYLLIIIAAIVQFSDHDNRVAPSSGIIYQLGNFLKRILGHGN